MLKYRLQVIILNQKDVSYRVIFKRYLNLKTVNFEYFNNYIYIYIYIYIYFFFFFLETK